MIFDVLIIGGGASGMSCALVLGSALKRPYATDKKVGIIAHQKASSLQNALFNNVYGIAPNTLGKDLMESSKQHLLKLYPEVHQIDDEKVSVIKVTPVGFEIITNKNSYQTKSVVVAISASSPFTILGLEDYVIAHQKMNPEKNRLQLKNTDHLVATNLYVCGVLAGHRSQLAIAMGSGAAVATDILTVWNNGMHAMVHDKIESV